MKRINIRLALVSAVASVSLLGLTGIGSIDNLGSNSASRIGGSWCC